MSEDAPGGLELFRRAQIAREAWELGRALIVPKNKRPVPMRWQDRDIFDPRPRSAR